MVTIMRKLTSCDLACVSQKIFHDYHVEDIRVKRGDFTDSDNYGIILGKSSEGHYVTWQFHLDENEEPTVYWGHYFMDNKNGAIKDFNSRDLPNTPVEISEKYWNCNCS